MPFHRLTVLRGGQLLSHALWSSIEAMLAEPKNRPGRKLSDALSVLGCVVNRYRCGITWRDDATGRSRGGSSTTIHQLVGGDGLSLVAVT